MQVIHPKKTTKSYKDCTLKGLILRSIKAGHQEAKQIYTAINYAKSLDALYAEMCRLNNYGYLSVTKHNGISIYSLTQKGEQHADDPYICVKQKEEWLKRIVDKKVMAILQDNDAVKRLAYDMTLKMPSSGGITEIVSPMGTPSIINSPNPINPVNPEILDVKDPYAAYHPGVKPVISSHRYEDEYGNPITFDEMLKRKTTKKDRVAQIKLRRELAQEYFNKKWIYGGFFTRWGGDYKLVKLKGNTLDIISTSNPEFRRMHVEDTLTPNANIGLHISKIDVHGVYISGERLNNKFLKF